MGVTFTPELDNYVSKDGLQSIKIRITVGRNQKAKKTIISHGLYRENKKTLRGGCPGEIPDPWFDRVKAYPSAILEQVFENAIS